MAAAPFIYERKVAFGDTDMAGIAHFTRLLDYVEEAEHALFFQTGIEPITPSTGWPRVKLEVDFTSAARFGETVRVELGIANIGGASLTWEFAIQAGERTCCRGRLVTTCVRRETDGGLKAEKIPAETRGALEKFLK